MKLPSEISLIRAEPSVVRVTAYPTQTVRLPVEVITHGRLPAEWELVSQKPSQPSVVVKVRESLLHQIKTVPTKPIDLSEVSSTRTQEVPLVLPEGVWPAEEMPGNLKVEFQLRRREAVSPQK
jgi:YbbR domain-containing protein